MTSGGVDEPYPAVVRTARLLLTAVSMADLDAQYAIHGDASTWRHFPEGRHGDIEVTRIKLDAMIEAWQQHGLGYWTVRLATTPHRPVIGIGGVQMTIEETWNLYYRFAPSAWGSGYAAEVCRAALDAAHQADPDRPVVAMVLAHNIASRRTAERVGLTVQAEHPEDPAKPDGPIRLIFADRHVSGSAAGHSVVG